MIVVDHVMGVPVKGVRHIYQIIMIVAVIFDTRLLLRGDLRKVRRIVRNDACIGGQQDANRQGEGQGVLKERRNLPFHPARFPAGSG
jgi:hypothetical protein